MDQEKIQELAAIFNRMLAPVRAVERGLASTIADYNSNLAKATPDVSGLAEVAEAAEAAAEWRAEAEAASVRAAEVLEELLEQQRRDALRVWISLAIAAASLVVSIVVAVFK